MSPVQNIEKPVGRKRGRGLQPTEANNTAIEKETKTLKARGADTTGTPSEGVEERAARELKNDVAIKIYWRKEMFEAKIKSYNAKTGKVEVLYRKDKTIEKVKLKDFYDRLIEIESSDGKGRNKNKKEAAPFSKTTGLLRASVMRPAKGLARREKVRRRQTRRRNARRRQRGERPLRNERPPKPLRLVMSRAAVISPRPGTTLPRRSTGAPTSLTRPRTPPRSRGSGP